MDAALHEVVVVGGGPAGVTAAILLRRQGHEVTLLERAHLPRPKPCGESLSPEVTPLLARLGVLDDVLSAGVHGRLRGFAVFPYADAPFRGTYAARSGADAVRAEGLTVPRLHLDATLLAAARHAGVRVREGWTVRAVGPWAGGARVVSGVAEDGGPFALRTPLVIGADGVHSTVARRLGLARPSRRLRQIAIVTHLRGVAALGAYGEMHVTPAGYCGVAPLGGGLANVAIVVPAPLRPWPPGPAGHGEPALDLPLASLAGEQPGGRGGIATYFARHLAGYPHLADRLRGATLAAGPWTTSNLACGVRSRVAGGLLLVGDAGGYYDPFTGEGIYRGLRSAALAAEVAGAALARGDTRAARLGPYARAYAREFVPKRLVEIIVHEVTTRRALFEHIAARLRRRPHLADALVGVTGDFLSPYEVLSPWYLARLLV